MTTGESAVGVRQTCELYGCSKDTLYRLIHDGSIPAFKVGRDWRMFPSKVQEALDTPTDLWAPPSRRKL